MIIKNGNVFTEDNLFIQKDVFTEGHFITEPKSEPSNGSMSNDEEIIDATGLYVIPGLTDIHFHGCVGYDFCDGTHEATRIIAEYQAKNGITSIAPATMTLNDELLTNIFANAGTYNSDTGALLMGIHMEGPYLNIEKKGAQNPAFLRKVDIDHFHKMNDLAKGLIKIVTIAPEEEGAMEFIKECKDEVVISVGHTTATYEIASEAFELGASHVTHLYNAMPLFTHRASGVIGAAFDSNHTTVELISDGVHITPTVVRATYKLFGDDRVILISDSMMATGLEDGEYSLGAQPVTVIGKKATLADGTIAGSATNLMDCMKTAVSFGIPLESAIKSAAVNSAKKIGIYDKVGSITPGKYANIVLLDKDLNVVKIILKGSVLN